MTTVNSEMIEELKLIFVTKDECSKIMDAEDAKITEIKVDIARIVSKLNILIAILSAIGASVMGVCIKLLFGA